MYAVDRTFIYKMWPLLKLSPSLFLGSLDDLIVCQKASPQALTTAHVAAATKELRDAHAMDFEKWSKSLKGSRDPTLKTETSELIMKTLHPEFLHRLQSQAIGVQYDAIPVSFDWNDKEVFSRLQEVRRQWLAGLGARILWLLTGCFLLFLLFFS